MENETEIKTIGVVNHDLDAAHAATGLPITNKDLFTAMRLLWESVSNDQRIDAMRRIRQSNDPVAA